MGEECAVIQRYFATTPSDVQCANCGFMPSKHVWICPTEVDRLNSLRARVAELEEEVEERKEVEAVWLAAQKEERAEHEAFRQRVVEVLAELHWNFTGTGEPGENAAYGIRKTAQVLDVWSEVEVRLVRLGLAELRGGR